MSDQLVVVNAFIPMLHEGHVLEQSLLLLAKRVSAVAKNIKECCSAAPTLWERQH